MTPFEIEGPVSTYLLFHPSYMLHKLATGKLLHPSVVYEGDTNHYMCVVLRITCAVELAKPL